MEKFQKNRSRETEWFGKYNHVLISDVIISENSWQKFNVVQAKTLQKVEVEGKRKTKKPKQEYENIK